MAYVVRNFKLTFIKMSLFIQTYFRFRNKTLSIIRTIDYLKKIVHLREICFDVIFRPSLACTVVFVWNNKATTLTPFIPNSFEEIMQKAIDFSHHDCNSQ